MGGRGAVTVSHAGERGDTRFQSGCHQDETGNHEEMRAIVSEQRNARASAIVGGEHAVLGQRVVAIEIAPPQRRHQRDRQKQHEEGGGAVRQPTEAAADRNDDLAEHNDRQQAVPFDEVAGVERETVTGVADRNHDIKKRRRKQQDPRPFRLDHAGGDHQARSRHIEGHDAQHGPGRSLAALP